jgi:colanic acid biosynthesis glycosyl transferase WcaI
MQKKIVVFTANYYPEDTAIGLYTSQFVNFLKDKNYDITVITGFPYYPKWEILDTYKNEKHFFTEIIHGVTIIRYKQFVPKNVSFFGRIKLMLSLLFGTLINLRKIKSCDAIICIVPFTISILPAFLLKRRTNAKLWVHIQDFEFDLAFESGILSKNNFVIRGVRSLISKVEKVLLKKANVISSISCNMLEKAKNKVPKANLFYFPNWINLEQLNFKDINKKHNYFNSEKFTLLYSGNVGEKQNWNLLLSLCSVIKDKDIEIIIVGDGSYLKTLKEKTEKYEFVKFFPLVPFEELPLLLKSADVHFLFQKTDVLDTVMPSKLLGMLGSGKPCIITGNSNSEVARTFRENTIGFFFDNDETKNIISAIEKIKNDNVYGNQLGFKASHYVEENFLEEKILNAFENKLRNEI